MGELGLVAPFDRRYDMVDEHTPQELARMVENYE
jgi:hypothetical protein